MNEEAQLKAIAAEYQVAGYRAMIDPVPGSYGLPEDMPALDMVVRRIGDPLDELALGPRLIIVEIVNRSRMVVTQSGRGDDPYWAQLDEAQAQKRFEAIAAALDAAGLSEDDVDFQIRFLDVSADQAAARAFLTFSPWDTDKLVREMVAMRRSVADSAKRADDRALSIIVSWARALRIIAHRFPGRKHAEMQTADLRTIQKDLYDARILDTPPSDYFRTHQSIMALFEGGEPEWPLLRGLEADLGRVLDHIIAHYLEGREVEPKQAAIDEGADHNLFEPLLAHIEAIEDENVRRLAREQFTLLRRTDRTPAFRQHLIDFEQTIRAHTESFGALLDTLRERTRLIGG